MYIQYKPAKNLVHVTQTQRNMCATQAENVV